MAFHLLIFLHRKGQVIRGRERLKLERQTEEQDLRKSLTISRIAVTFFVDGLADRFSDATNLPTQFNTAD